MELHNRKNGRERPQKLFGRLKAEKVGSLPPVFVVLAPLLFEIDLWNVQCIRCLRRSEVKTMARPKVQCVKVTFFTAPPPALHFWYQSV
jgi:hypothetical protein